MDLPRLPTRRPVPGGIPRKGIAVAAAVIAACLAARWGRAEPELGTAALWGLVVAVFAAAAARRLRRDLA